MPKLYSKILPHPANAGLFGLRPMYNTCGAKVRPESRRPALSSPRATPARCVALGEALRPALENSPRRIALVATGGMSHDPGELRHGWIDTDFDHTFIDRMSRADLPALASYRDEDLVNAGAGTTELLAWLCLAGVMGATKPRLVAYEPVAPWATGIGIMSYARAA